MGKHDKIVWRILKATSDSNIAFYDLCNLLIYLGFKMRTKGSHHIFRKPGVTEKINIQKDGSKAKPYQVKQVRDLILKYKFGDKTNAAEPQPKPLFLRQDNRINGIRKRSISC